MGSTLLINDTAPIPAPLVWGGDILGIVLMLSGQFMLMMTDIEAEWERL